MFDTFFEADMQIFQTKNQKNLMRHQIQYIITILLFFIIILF